MAVASGNPTPFPRTVRKMTLFPELRGLLVRYAVLLCSFTLLGFLGRYWWVLDLFSHFRIQYALLGVTLLACSVRLQMKRTAWACCCVMAMNFLLVLPYVHAWKTPSIPTGTTFSALMLNVHTSNTRYQDVFGYIVRTRPDVVILEEVNGEWCRQANILQSTYATVIQEPRADNFGIALYTSLKVTRGRIEYLGDKEIPSVHAQVWKNGLTVHVLGTHALPPVSKDHSIVRTNQLQGLSTFVRSLKEPCAVLGDLNCTPWSVEFTDLLGSAGLVDSSTSEGLTLSWPAPIWPAMIPIDHCLVSAGIRVIAKNAGPHLGSDHLPIVTLLEVQD